MRRHLTLIAGAFLGLLTVASTVGGCGSDDDIAFPPTKKKPREYQPAEGGVRRLLMPQYINSVRYLLGDGAANAAINIDLLPADQQVQGYYAVGAAQTPPGLPYPELWDLTAEAVAAAVVADASGLAQWAPCVVEGPQDDSCYDSVAEDFGKMLFRRPVSSDEKKWITGIAKQARAWDDGKFITGVQWALRGMLQSPSFLYLSEIGDSDAEKAGRRLLNNHELASRLAFFLTDTTPDAALMAAAEAGELSDSEEMRLQAQRLLATPAAKEAVKRRFAEILYLNNVRSAQKHSEVYPEFNDTIRDAMVTEVELLLDDIVWTRDADLRELYTADYTYVNGDLAGYYGVNPPASGWKKVTLPADQERAGFLSSGAFLARAGHSITTSPTKRGVFIRDRVLCQVVPPPDADVNPSFKQPNPNDPPKTTKQIVEEHMKEKRCAKCHALFDPYGLALEHYDTVGRYRAIDAGKPVDSSGSIDDFGSFASARDIARLLISDEQKRVSWCLLLNMYRSSFGHIEKFSEEPALMELHQVFGERGYTLQNLMVEMTVNPAFRYVAELPEGSK